MKEKLREKAKIADAPGSEREAEESATRSTGEKKETTKTKPQGPLAQMSHLHGLGPSEGEKTGPKNRFQKKKKEKNTTHAHRLEPSALDEKVYATPERGESPKLKGIPTNSLFREIEGRGTVHETERREGAEKKGGGGHHENKG